VRNGGVQAPFRQFENRSDAEQDVPDGDVLGGRAAAFADPREIENQWRDPRFWAPRVTRILRGASVERSSGRC
jgi:hypothetical protein